MAKGLKLKEFSIAYVYDIDDPRDIRVMAHTRGEALAMARAQVDHAIREPWVEHPDNPGVCRAACCRA